MKSFTAKEFSRCPAKVYEAAREDGSVEITHDRFEGKFMLRKVNAQRYEYDKLSETTNGLELARQAYQARKQLIEAGVVPPDQLTSDERKLVGIIVTGMENRLADYMKTNEKFTSENLGNIFTVDYSGNKKATD